MTEFEAKFYLILKISLICFMLFVLSFLSAQKIVVGNELIYSSDTKFVQGLFPDSRVQVNNDYISIIDEPVYYNIYSPRKFSKLLFDLTYNKSDNINSQIGIKLNVNDYAFYFHNIPDSEEEFVTEQFEFALDQVEIKNNKIQVVISAPDINNEIFYVKDAKFKFVK
jgi:hypothetical protein